MSRSSKGFADFFPTAPSVLQQKRFKAAQFRRRLKSPSAGGSKPANVPCEPPASPHGETKGTVVPSSGERLDHILPDSAQTAQEEGECVHGDLLLNGVGSASSTSTASSVFSTGHHTLNMAHPNETTPLTNVDSSPPSNTQESPQQPRTRDCVISAGRSNRSPSPQQVTEVQPPIVSPYVQPTSTFQARPGNGEVKGLKITYDPYRNKKLTPEERRSAEVQYEEFGKEVSLISSMALAIRNSWQSSY